MQQHHHLRTLLNNLRPPANYYHHFLTTFTYTTINTLMRTVWHCRHAGRNAPLSTDYIYDKSTTTNYTGSLTTASQASFHRSHTDQWDQSCHCIIIYYSITLALWSNALSANHSARPRLTKPAPMTRLLAWQADRYVFCEPSRQAGWQVVSRTTAAIRRWLSW